MIPRLLLILSLVLLVGARTESVSIEVADEISESLGDLDEVQPTVAVELPTPDRPAIRAVPTESHVPRSALVPQVFRPPRHSIDRV